MLETGDAAGFAGGIFERQRKLLVATTSWPTTIDARHFRKNIGEYEFRLGFLSVRQFSLQACILLSAIASAASASAQQSSEGDSTPSATPISKVEVKAKVDSVDLRRDDTASKIVLTHEEIVKYGDTNVFDVLKRVPGVTIGAAAGRNSEIRMRGLGNGYTQILVNGERTAAGFSIESLSPDAIERIEIMRVATAEYSTQAIAGTINIVLKKTIKVADRELKLSAGAGDGGGISPRIIYQASDRLDSFSYSVTTTA